MRTLSHPRTWRPRKPLLALTVAALASTLLGFAPQSAAAAPPTPPFGPAIDAYATYDPQRTCSGSAKPGVVGFRDLLNATYGPHTSGIVRDCAAGGTSEHKEGRALDYHVDVNNPSQRAIANDILFWLLATDRHGNTHANARRLGVMYIIWNRQMWRAYRPHEGWQSISCDGSPSDCHTNHIHFSFSWAGAWQHTSWWNPPPPPPPDYSTVGVSSVIHDGVLRVFMRGANGSLWQAFWYNNQWVWQDLGGQIQDRPTAVVHEGTLRVFVRSSTNTLWQYFWTGQQWSGQDLGGIVTSGPAAIVDNGLLRVFFRSATGSLWQHFWTGQQWVGQDLGGLLGSGPSVVAHNGILRVFFRSSTGSLWQHFWTGQQWVGQDLGGIVTSSPAAIVDGGVLRVFFRSSTGSLWQHFWTGQQWVGQDLGGIVTSGPAAVTHDGILRVFFRSSTSSLWQHFWTGQQWVGQDLGGILA